MIAIGGYYEADADIEAEVGGRRSGSEVSKLRSAGSSPTPTPNR